MYVASMDIKTAVDVAMDSQDTHERIMAALLREMANLDGKAAFESVKRSFPFTKCIRQGV